MTGRMWRQGDPETRGYRGQGHGERCLRDWTPGWVNLWVTEAFSPTSNAEVHAVVSASSADGLFSWIEGSKWASWEFPGDLSVETLSHILHFLPDRIFLI